MIPIAPITGLAVAGNATNTGSAESQIASLGVVGGVTQTESHEMKAMTYLDWCKTVGSFLSLDISVRGTGWAMWKDGSLTWGRYTIKADAEVERVEEFRRFLLDLIDGYSFDYYIVEDVIASINFKTVRSLITLNNILDTLIYEQKVQTPVASFKEVNTTWKKHLKSIAGDDFVIKAVNYNNGSDKECTKACLEALGITPETLKMGKYTDKHVEDICDALGMALGTLAVRVSNAPVHKSTVVTTDIRKGYKIKQFVDRESAMKSANRCAKNKAKPIIEFDLVSEPNTDLIRFMAKKLPEEPNGLYVVRVPVDKCCNLLLMKRLATELPVYYLTITK